MSATQQLKQEGWLPLKTIFGIFYIKPNPFLKRGN